MVKPPRTFRVLLVVAALLLLGGCLKQSEPVPTFGGTELYPLQVGTYRVFDVVDTTWRLNVPTISTYQLREVVADSFPSLATSLSPAGVSYRIVRSRRADATRAWANDSVFLLTRLPQALLLNRGNRRTLELLFPVRKGQVWNRLAYDGQDSITRRYRRVDEPVTLQLPGGQTKVYERSIRTADLEGDSLYYIRSYEQIYVSGIGPVHRERRSLDTYSRDANTGEQIPNPNYFFEGYTHREVLIDQGKL